MPVISMILSFIVFAGVSLTSAPAGSQLESRTFICGVDISALEQVEESGAVFSDGGTSRDAIDILRDHGVNFARLRLWHSPEGKNGSFDSVRRLAVRAGQAGMGLLLDIHYSDDWADPGKQYKPVAWKGLSFETLADSVRAYTADVVSRLSAAGAAPDIVQIGNEITCGMLWDDGRVCGRFDDEEQWRKLAELIRAAMAGVRDGSGDGAAPRIMIHFDDGGDNSGCRRFFDRLAGSGVEFDIIGLSFYPWWHGTFGDLEANLGDLAARYGKNLIIVETAYPWTLEWFDNGHNMIGQEGQLHAGYEATIDGQRRFLNRVIEIVENTGGGKGSGVFYWAPEWISAPGADSPWENMTLFDFSGNALHSIRAFE